MQDTLGKITVLVPGVPVRATSNRAIPEEPFYVDAYTVQRLEESQGKLYIQLIESDNRTAKSRMLAVLSKSTPAFGAGITIQGNVLDMSRVWIDADSAGDSVLIPILEY